MKYNSAKLLCFAGSLIFGASNTLEAQDTLHITLSQAEQKLSEKNLSLLAQKYNIDIARANVLQAKLYHNPNISLTGAVYNHTNNKIFDVGNQGEYAINIQQLLMLAGKRNKQIKLVETSTTMSENSFYDLLRTLKYSLRSTFYQVYYLQQSVRSYQVEIDSLQRLTTAYETLQEKGVVTLKDAVRIKSLFYSLKADQSTLQNSINDLEADMQILLQSNGTYFFPDAGDRESLTENIKKLNLQQLTDTAYANRYDLKLSANDILYSQQNYTYQKALAVPDLTVGASFDKNGSYINNANFLTVAMDLPFFNRNQGNIKAAKITIDQSQIAFKQEQQTVQNDVYRAYSKLLNSNKLLESIDTSFQNKFEKLLGGVTENFEKKNISLIDFTDFYESYKDNIVQFNNLQNDRMQALESLGFAIGKPLFTN
ncbi:MAG: TolC family protein [Ferruginibacter sp.]